MKIQAPLAILPAGKLGAKDLSMFIKRKQIAPEILALLGEYKDPRINYAKSVTKMSSLIANDRLLHGIKDVAMGSFIFEEDTRPPEATVQLAGISQRNIIFLMRGETPPLNISDQSFRAAYNRAKLMMDDKAAEEVRSRFRRIQEARPE